MRRRGADRDVIVLEKDGTPAIGWLVLGAAVGAGLALLFAPASGEETRRRLSRGARRLRETASDAIEELKDGFEDLTDRAAEKVDEVRSAVRGGVEEAEEGVRAVAARHKSTVAEAREELERRLADARARRRGAETEDQEPVA